MTWPMTRVRLATVFCLLAAASLVAAQAPAPAAADLVLIDVVVERGNDVVLGLSRADFEVASDWQVRPIESFSASAEDEPLTAVLLVDVTVSTRMVNVGSGHIVSTFVPGVLDKRMETLLGLFSSLIRPADRGLVGGIAGRVVLSRRFTSDTAELVAAGREVLLVPGVDTFGPSPIWDAVESVVGVLAREPGRKTVLLRTDGMATGNLRSVKYVGARATEAGISVNVLAVGEEDAQRGISPHTALQWIAAETGGAFAVDTTANPKRELTHMMTSLRHAYTLGISGDRDGRPHRLEVRVKKPGLKVRARKAYGG